MVCKLTSAIAIKSKVTIRNAASSLVWTDARMPATQRTSVRSCVRLWIRSASFSSLISGCSADDGFSSEDCTLFLPPSVLVHLRPRPYISRIAGTIVVRTPSRILIVDDNTTNIKILQTLPAADGYEVLTAADSDDVLLSALQHPQELIL